MVGDGGTAVNGSVHGGMSKDENRVHFGGWCIVSSPLILAYDFLFLSLPRVTVAILVAVAVVVAIAVAVAAQTASRQLAFFIWLPANIDNKRWCCLLWRCRH